MNNFSKLLLSVLTILLIIIYLQNVSLKREIESLKNKIDGIQKSEMPTSSLGKKLSEKMLEEELKEEKLKEEVIFIGNSKTLKFHLPYCQWARRINPANKVYFKSREEALKRGYKPCKICNP